MPVRILLAEDHPMFRRSLARLIGKEETLEVVAETGRGDEVLRLVEVLRPDVLVLDMDLPGLSGPEVARQLTAKAELSVRILAFSAHESPTYVQAMLEGGAAGYVTKAEEPELVIEAIKAVARGERRWFVDPSRAAALPVELKEREREVLTLLAGGRSNAEIADELALSPHTVRNYLARVYEKVGVNTAREAVAWAWRHGLAQ